MSKKAAEKRIAFFGGSFDPVHSGHIEIAKVLVAEFGIDLFIFIPAFHAPHKRKSEPASPFHRFAMLALATDGLDRVAISTIELEDPERPYTIETMKKVRANFTNADIFFVIGADSWMDINTWRHWEKVLTSTNIIVVTRPGIEIGFSHVTDEIKDRIVDLRGKNSGSVAGPAPGSTGLIPDVRSKPSIEYSRTLSIYITDSVNADISATALRRAIRKGEKGWEGSVPEPVVRHIMKYGLYT